MSCAIGTRIDGVPHFDVKITDQNLNEVAKLLIEHVKKDWDPNALCRKDFNDGITNKLVGYFLKENNASKITEHGRTEIVLIRIYGAKTELIINRAQELRNIEELSKNNIAPPLYCTFSNGYCYKFIEGKVCTPHDFTTNDILPRHSAQYIAKLHTTNLSENYKKHHKMESTIFETIKQYINIMPKKFSTAEQQTRYKDKVPAADKLYAEVQTLVHATLHLSKMAVTFCHNDLLIANIIFDEREEKLHCIDHEYGTPNYSAYDIANHFNEFCGVDTVDYSLYPKKETQLWWLRLYLEKLNELKGVKTTVSDEEVAEWYIQVDHMSLVSHLFWGVWAQIQAYHSQIDFDFMGYGIIRLDEYFKRKEQVLEKYMNELIL